MSNTKSIEEIDLNGSEEDALDSVWAKLHSRNRVNNSNPYHDEKGRFTTGLPDHINDLHSHLSTTVGLSKVHQSLTLEKDGPEHGGSGTGGGKVGIASYTIRAYNSAIKKEPKDWDDDEIYAVKTVHHELMHNLGHKEDGFSESEKRYRETTRQVPSSADDKKMVGMHVGMLLEEAPTEILARDSVAKTIGRDWNYKKDSGAYQQYVVSLENLAKHAGTNSVELSKKLKGQSVRDRLHTIGRILGGAEGDDALSRGQKYTTEVLAHGNGSPIKKKDFKDTIKDISNGTKPIYNRLLEVDLERTRNTNPNHDEKGRFAVSEALKEHLHGTSIGKLADKTGLSQKKVKEHLETIGAKEIYKGVYIHAQPSPEVKGDKDKETHYKTSEDLTDKQKKSWKQSSPGVKFHDGVHLVPISSIKVNQDIEPERTKGLQEAVKGGKTLPPAVARLSYPMEDKIQLLDGNHRYLAAKKEGQTHIPVVFVKSSADKLDKNKEWVERISSKAEIPTPLSVDQKDVQADHPQRIKGVLQAFKANKGYKDNLVDIADISDALKQSHKDTLDTIQHLRKRGILSAGGYEGGRSGSKDQQEVLRAQEGEQKIGYVSLREGKEDELHRLTSNVFCATGQGGGVDPSCPLVGGRKIKLGYTESKSLGKDPITGEHIFGDSRVIDLPPQKVSDSILDAHANALKHFERLGISTAGMRDIHIVASKDGITYATGTGLTHKHNDEAEKEYEKEYERTKLSRKNSEVPSYAFQSMEDRMIHEIGHNIGRTMSKKDNKEWERLVSKNQQNVNNLPSFYAQENSSEAFAESVLAVVKGYPFGGRTENYGKQDKAIENFVRSRLKQPIRNVFCPTGKGGGISPTCGKEDSRVSTDSKTIEKEFGAPQGNWRTPIELPGENKGKLPPIKPFKAPPLPKGKAGESKAGGVSAVDGMTNTHIGDLVEHVLGKGGKFKSLLPPGQRQNPLDVKYDESDQGFEIKGVSTHATEYKSAPKSEEVEAKETYAKQYGFNPNLIVAVIDTDNKTIHTYMRKDKVQGSLYKGGKLNDRDFYFLGSHKFSEEDIESTRPKKEKDKVDNANPEGCNQHTGPNCSKGEKKGDCGLKECTSLAIFRLTGKMPRDKKRSVNDTIDEVEKRFGPGDYSLMKEWRGKTVREFANAGIKGFGLINVGAKEGEVEGHIMPFMRGKPENVLDYWDRPINIIVRFTEK